MHLLLPLAVAIALATIIASSTAQQACWLQDFVPPASAPVKTTTRVSLKALINHDGADPLPGGNVPSAIALARNSSQVLAVAASGTYQVCVLKTTSSPDDRTCANPGVPSDSLETVWVCNPVADLVPSQDEGLAIWADARSETSLNDNVDLCMLAIPRMFGPSSLSIVCSNFIDLSATKPATVVVPDALHADPAAKPVITPIGDRIVGQL